MNPDTTSKSLQPVLAKALVAVLTGLLVWLATKPAIVSIAAACGLNLTDVAWVAGLAATVSVPAANWLGWKLDWLFHKFGLGPKE